MCNVICRMNSYLSAVIYNISVLLTIYTWNFYNNTTYHTYRAFL